MNKEQILAKVMELNCHGTYGTEYLDVEKFNALVAALQQDIRDESNKALGRADTARLAKAIIKDGIKNGGRNDRNKMAYACTMDGIQYVLDGHRIAAFYDPVGVPEWGGGSKNWFRVDRLIQRDFYSDIPMTLPTAGELKAELKIAKAEKKRCLYTFCHDGAYIHINAQFLLDYVQAFPDMRVYANNTGASAGRNPIYVSSDKGFGIILPVNLPKLQVPGFHHV